MITFEITLKGFDGTTDDTDHLVKWVNAPDQATLDRWLDENSLTDYLSCETRNLIESGCVPKGAGRDDGVDFVIGEDLDASLVEWKRQSQVALTDT